MGKAVEKRESVCRLESMPRMNEVTADTGSNPVLTTIEREILNRFGIVS